MVSLLHGKPGSEFSFDERALMHRRVVITAKLRHRESFLCIWTNSPDVSRGRSSLWLGPSSVIGPRSPRCGARTVSRRTQVRLPRRPRAPDLEPGLPGEGY